MTSTVKQPVGSRAALACAALPTLASGSYATTDVAQNNVTNQPVDNLVEVMVKSGTVSGTLPYVAVFAIASIDGTSWQTGANATDEAVMTLLGTIPLNSIGTAQRKFFGVKKAFDDVLPPNLKIVLKNASGAALTDGSVYISEVNLTVG